MKQYFITQLQLVRYQLIKKGPFQEVRYELTFKLIKTTY